MTTDGTLRLYLVRHGVTAWNRAMRMQGHTDVPLDEEGLEQARRTGARLASLPTPLDAVWSSDLCRALQTAEAIATPHGLTVRTTPLLRETKLGAWEGLTRADIEARGDGALLERYRHDPHGNRPPGGETLEAAWDRMMRAAAEIRAAHPSGNVAVVGHGGSLRALLCDAMDAPVTSMRRFFLDNASLNIIEELPGPEGRMRRVLLVNDTSHLACPAAPPL